MVLQALAASGLPPERLELEITEAVLLQDSQNTLAVLHQLRQLGVRIAMDDFGTRLLLAQLPAQLPLRQDQDRPGVHRRHGSQRGGAALSEAIIGLGSSLGMETVAEGVENYAQLEMVRELRLHRGAGLLFQPCRPRQGHPAAARHHLRPGPQRGLIARGVYVLASCRASSAAPAPASMAPVKPPLCANDDAR